jgi:hypothetical protein
MARLKIGISVFYGMAFILYVMGIYFCFSNWEWAGLILAILLFPLAIVFPFLCWGITGMSTYTLIALVVWSIALGGLLLTLTTSPLAISSAQATPIAHNPNARSIDEPSLIQIAEESR